MSLKESIVFVDIILLSLIFFKRVKRDIMGEIVASNVHPYFSDRDVSHNATVLRKTVITSMDVDK